MPDPTDDGTTDEPTPGTHVETTQDESTVPRPSAATLAAWSRNAAQNKIRFIMQRFGMIYPALPEDVQNTLIAALRQTSGRSDPLVALEEVLTKAGPNVLDDLYKLALQFAARTLTWADINAQATIDPVIAWALAKSKARQGDTRATEIDGWLAWAGPLAEMLQNAGRSIQGATRQAGRALGGGLSDLLSELFKNPLLLGLIAIAIYYAMKGKDK